MSYVLKPLLVSAGYVLPHSVEKVFDTIRQWEKDNNNNNETNWRNRELEKQSEAVKK